MVNDADPSDQADRPADAAGTGDGGEGANEPLDPRAFEEAGEELEADAAEAEEAAAAEKAEGDAPSEASGGGSASGGAKDPEEAAEPDGVIREPEDIPPDTADGEGGEARRVDVEGRTEPMGGGKERPSPKAALVYNPIKVDADTLRALVERLSSEAGWQEPLFYETTVDDLGDDVTREALKSGVNAVLVAGGDGTVRAVAEAMSESGVPLTIVPSGTGNLLARNLQLPLTDPEITVQATFDGDQLPVDVGFAALRREDGTSEERAFVVMGGMGLDAAMIANTNSDLKKKVGWVAYVDGAARSLANAKPFRIMYQVAGRRLHSARVQSVLIANCGSLPAGLELIPEASVSDGNLDIAIFQPKNVLGWVLVWRRVAWDNSFLRRFRAGRRVIALRTKDNTVIYARGKGLDVATSPAQPVQLDGDEFGDAIRIRCRIVEGGLITMVPKGHATAEL